MESVTRICRIPTLRSCRGDSSFIQNYCRATEFRYSKNHQRRIRSGFHPAVCILNVDIGVAELGGGPCQLTRSVWKLDLNNLSFRVGYSFPIQDSPRCSLSSTTMYTSIVFSEGSIEKP